MERRGSNIFDRSVTGSILLVSYGIPLLLLSALGYCLYDFLSLTDPLILAGLTFLFGIFHMIRKLDDHKRELWEKLRKLG